MVAQAKRLFHFAHGFSIQPDWLELNTEAHEKQILEL
jgi:hypothetical protein